MLRTTVRVADHLQRHAGRGHDVENLLDKAVLLQKLSDAGPNVAVVDLASDGLIRSGVDGAKIRKRDGAFLQVVFADFTRIAGAFVDHHQNLARSLRVERDRKECHGGQADCQISLYDFQKSDQAAPSRSRVDGFRAGCYWCTGSVVALLANVPCNNTTVIVPSGASDGIWKSSW